MTYPNLSNPRIVLINPAIKATIKLDLTYSIVPCCATSANASNVNKELSAEGPIKHSLEVLSKAKTSNGITQEYSPV